MLQENTKLNVAKKYIQELEIIKDKFMKNIDYEIKLMSEGPAKDEFI